MDIYTNSVGKVCRTKTASRQAAALFNEYEAAEGVTMYFVGAITNSNAVGFRSGSNIVIGKESPKAGLAHELGHALGLADCYVAKKNSQDIEIFLSNADSQIADDMFGSIATDWCAGSGRGFTESAYTREIAIMCLLMHGCAKKHARNGCDIPSGKIKALHADSSTGDDVDYVSVGAEQIKPNNTEVYSE